MSEFDYAVAGVRRIVDGDTFDLTLEREFDFGFYLTERKRYAVRLRLLGVDTPERKEPGYLDALSFTGRWFDAHAGTVRVRTAKADAFGRWLADPYTPGGTTLAGELLAAGYAVPWRRGR